MPCPNIQRKVISFWPLKMPASTTHIIERSQKESTPTQYKQRRALAEAHKAREAVAADTDDLGCISTETSVLTTTEDTKTHRCSTSQRCSCRHKSKDEKELPSGLVRRSQEFDGFQTLISLGCRTFEGPEYIRMLSYLLTLSDRDLSFRNIVKKLISAQINRTDIVNNVVVTSEFIPRYDLIISENPIHTVEICGRSPTLIDFCNNGFLRSILTRSGLPYELDIYSFILPLHSHSFLGDTPTPTIWGCWRALLSLPRVSAERSNCDTLVLLSTLFIIANEDLPKGTPLRLPSNRTFEQNAS